MKKALIFILMLAMISSLTLTVFAASPGSVIIPGPTSGSTDDPGTDDPGTTDPGTDDPGTTDPGTDDPGTTDPGTTTSDIPNQSGASEITKITASMDSNITVEVVAPTASYDNANRAAAEQRAQSAGTEIIATLGSFDVMVKDNGEIVHQGATVEMTFNTANYIGQYLTIFENTDGTITVPYSRRITAASTTVTLRSFSTFTPVVTGSAIGSSTSPQTQQSILTAALVSVAVVSLFGIAYAAKRRFD